MPPDVGNRKEDGWEMGSNLLSLHFNQLILNLNEFYLSLFRNVKIKDLTPFPGKNFFCRESGFSFSRNLNDAT